MTNKQYDECHNEAAIMARLKHCNIVRIFKSFEDDNKLYIVMEYCENMDLSAFLES